MKRVYFFVLLALLLISTVSAITIQSKQEYKPSETFLAAIEGNFLSPLDPSQISFTSERLNIPLIFDIAKINDKYYIYAMLQNKERNYTLKIKNLHFYENSQEKLENIEFNFSAKGDVIDFSVIPGFIITSKNFSLEIESQNKALSVTANFAGHITNVSVSAGQKKNIFFNTDNITHSVLETVALSSGTASYSIPVAIIVPNRSQEESNVTVVQSSSFRFNIPKLQQEITANSNWLESVYLMNYDEETQEVKITTENLSASIFPESFSIKSKKAEAINITIASQAKGRIIGKIIAKSSKYIAELPVEMTVKDNVSDINNSQVPALSTCSQLGGKICKVNATYKEECKSISRNSLEGICCIQTSMQEVCIPVAPNNNGNGKSTKIWGIILIVLVIAAVAFFLYKKSRKPKPDFKNLLQKKTQEIEQRSKSTQIPEVRNQLSRT